MQIKDILKHPISRKPISANFIKSAKPEKLMIEPVRTVASFDEKGKENIELWLSFCALGTTILDTGTKMLSHIGVIHKRDAIFDLIKAFKQLRKHFSENDNFDEKERSMDDFFYTFLTSDEATQNRVIKFQESILNKNERTR